MTILEIIGNQQVRIQAYEEQMQQLAAANKMFMETDKKQTVANQFLLDTLKSTVSTETYGAIMIELDNKLADLDVQPAPSEATPVPEAEAQPAENSQAEAEAGTGA